MKIKTRKYSHGEAFTPNQMMAIRRAIQLGKKIQRDFPEIAKDYREGRLLVEIVEKYNLCSYYHVHKDAARKAARNAIIGHNGSFKIREYEGAI